MQLRTSIVLILSGVALVSLAATFLIQRAAILPSFDELESREAQTNLHRAIEGIEQEIAHLDTFCHDWAAWDDSYAFVQDGNRAYVDSNLTQTGFQVGEFDLAFYVDRTGRVVWGQVREHGGGAPIRLARFATDRWSLADPLLATTAVDGAVTGIESTERGPMLVSSRPLLTSLRDGPAAGWIVMGRFLDDAALERLCEQTQVACVVHPAPEAGPAFGAERVALLAGDRDLTAAPVEEVDERVRRAFGLMRDLEGRPALFVCAELPRSITAKGAAATRFALASSAAATLALLIAVILLLRRLIVDPLAELTAHAVRVGRSDDLDVRLASPRRGEIGVLAREFDCMVERLSLSRAQIVEAARLGGMSEVATSVLHNVGNALNSVHVSAGEVQRNLDGSSWRDVERVLALLDAQTDLGAYLAGDERGRRLPGFLRELLRDLAAQRAAILRETRSLSEGLEHIRSLTDAQQEFAGRRGIVEQVSLAAAFERALAVSQASSSGTDVTCEFAEVEPIELERHRLLEILVNLLRNAHDAVAGLAPERRRIVARIERGEGVARLSVEDNGEGIAAENLTRIFGHGFTTKPHGHGFGLHASANTARALGGRLRAESEGPGRGARFVLELPLRVAPEVAAVP